MNDPFPSFRSLRSRIHRDILLGSLCTAFGGLYGGVMLGHAMHSWEFTFAIFLIALTGVVIGTAAMLAACFYFQHAIDVRRELVRREREADEVELETHYQHIGIRAENT